MDRMEDADTLSLGAFQNAKTLFNCEVALILEQVADQDERCITDTFRQVQDYVQRFNKFKSETAVAEVRDILNSQDHGAYDTLHEFQKASLANLLPESVEEACALIHSLKDGQEETLGGILTNLKTTQSFVGA